MANKITTLIEVRVDEAIGGMRRFRQAVADADGFMGKFKAGASSAFGALKQHSAEAALAAGAALVAFGAKSAAVFQETALNAEHLANTMGVGSEEASRLQAVFGQLGIELGDAQDVMGNLASIIAENDEALSQMGVSIARDHRGRVDMNESFIRIVESIGKIQDPARRAAMAAKFFGEEGARQFGPLVAQSEELREKLAAVSNEQVIDPAEIRKAKEMQQAQRDIKRAMDDLMMTVGELVVELAPLIQAMADVAAVGTEGITKVVDFLGDLNGAALDHVTEELLLMAGATGELTEEQIALEEAEKAAAEAREAATAAQRDATQAAEDRLRAERDLRNELLSQIDAQRAYERAVDDGESAITEYNEAVAASDATMESVDDAARSAADSLIGQAEAFAKSKGAADGSAESVRYQVDELYRLATALSPDSPLRARLLAYIGELQAIPAEIATRLALNITQGAVTTKGGDAIGGRYVPGGSNARAAGGPVAAGEAYLVGEKGPEILQMGSTGGHVVPNHALGGVTINVDARGAVGLNGPQVERWVAEALARHQRRNGRA